MWVCACVGPILSALSGKFRLTAGFPITCLVKRKPSIVDYSVFCNYGERNTRKLFKKILVYLGKCPATTFLYCLVHRFAELRKG